MRRILIPFAILFLAACASQPTAVETQQQQAAPPAATDTRGHLMGLTAEELVQRFGTPALQIREENSWKLQFRSGLCVLDAYLYPGSGSQAAYRVTYVETRTPSLGRIDQLDCISSFRAP